MLRAETPMTMSFVQRTCMCIVLCSVVFGCSRDNGKMIGLGLRSMGDPDAALSESVAALEGIRTSTGRYPSYDEFARGPHGRHTRHWRRYSWTDNSFQVFWWSGETMWVYISETRQYIEFDGDVLHELWYDIAEKRFRNDIATVKSYP